MYVDRRDGFGRWAKGGDFMFLRSPRGWWRVMGLKFRKEMASARGAAFASACVSVSVTRSLGVSETKSEKAVQFSVKRKSGAGSRYAW